MSGRRRPVNQTIKLRFEYIALGNLQFHLFSTNSDAIRDRIETVNLLDYPAFSTGYIYYSFTNSYKILTA